jgi:hypothetical protein
MKYQYTLYRPGVTFTPKGQPLGVPPIVVDFEAQSHTHARNEAERMFREDQQNMELEEAKQAWWGVGLA